MMLARFGILLTCLALFGCSLPERPGGAIGSVPRKPNIIFILVDDMGWGDVGYHGSEIATPNIDALAARGVVVDRAYAFPICSPTRAALMTGRNPLQYGVDGPMENNAMLPQDMKLLPAYLRDAGYQTWMVGKWHLGMSRVSAMPQLRGFDTFYGSLGGFIDFYTHVYFGGLDWQRDGKSLREEGYATDLETKEALRLLDNSSSDKPFFMYLSYQAPHTPLQHPPGAEASYAEIKNADRRVYAQMLTHADSAIGKVIDRIKQRGLAENTILVFMSDNGGSADVGGSNGSLRGGKGSAFEGGVRVPAIISWPGKLGSAKMTSGPLFVQDWLPTLLESAGIGYNKADFDGESRWRAITSSAQTPSSRSVIIGTARSKAVFSWPFKLVRDPTLPSDALYNVVADPTEQVNLAASHSALTKQLGAMIDALPQNPSKGAKGPPPEAYFRDSNGAFNHRIRMPETREPWAEAAQLN